MLEAGPLGHVRQRQITGRQQVHRALESRLQDFLVNRTLERGAEPPLQHAARKAGVARDGLHIVGHQGERFPFAVFALPKGAHGAHGRRVACQVEPTEPLHRHDRSRRQEGAGFGQSRLVPHRRRAVAEAGDRKQLPFEPLYVGRAWDRQVEIDVVAISRRERAVLLGECKWHNSKMGPQDLTDLRERSERLKHLDGFKKHYALFSRSGFTKQLERQALQEDVILFDGADFKRIVE